MRGGGFKRANYIKKKKLFGAIGVHCCFQPYIFPQDPQCIFLGDNVLVASDVSFINHDQSDSLLNWMDSRAGYIGPRRFKYYLLPIHVGNNVIIGARAMIMPGKSIGNNVVIGAGSVVSKDIPSNTVWGGNPIRQIGTFEEFMNKREHYSLEYDTQ